MSEVLQPERKDPCDRAELVIARAEAQSWVTVHDRDSLKRTIRMALDTEVEAGGPFLNFHLRKRENV